MNIDTVARPRLRRSSVRVLAVLAVVLLVASACGGTGTTATTTAASAPAPTDVATTIDGGDSTAADESLEPVKIGLIVQDEELIAFPEIRAVANAMVGYFNAEKGGIDGHPVALEACGAGDTPESATACAQQLANADDVHIVIQGTLNSTAPNEILAGVGTPVLTLNNDVPDMLFPGVYAADPGALGLANAIFVHAAEDAGATSMTFFYADDPFFESFIPLVEALAGGQGITVNENIPLGFEADLTGPVSAADTASDVWFFALDGSQCAAAGNAATTVGFEGRIMAMDACLSRDAVESGAVNGWFGPSVTSLTTTDGDDSAEFRRILDTYGDAEATPFGLGGWTAGNMDIAYQVLVAAGGIEATDASVNEALASFESSDVIGFPPVSCPGPGSFVGACDTSPLVVEVVDGAMTSSGEFMELDYSVFEILLEG